MNLFIACSSSDDMYLDVLESSGMVLQNLASSKDYDLVTGGNTGGLMQFCYNAFHDHGRMITAIIASSYQEDIASMYCDIKIVTEDTFERTRQILNHADACLFMPGGVGTVAEFFGILEEKRTYGQDVPMILYNEDRSFDPLLRMMDSFYKNGYADREVEKNYKVVYDQESLFTYLDSINKDKREVKTKK